MVIIDALILGMRLGAGSHVCQISRERERDGEKNHGEEAKQQEPPIPQPYPKPNRKPYTKT